jgi:hypothetical protein
MEVGGTDKTRQAFEELLAAAWAEQLAGLHLSPGVRVTVASREDHLKAQETENK